MKKKFLFILALLALAGCGQRPPDATTVLENAARTMGATNLKSIRYSGSGYYFALAQSYNPNEPWPKFNAKSYVRVVDYDTVSSREELVRTREDPPRGGGFQPLIGERREVGVVSGEAAWTIIGDDLRPSPEAAAERRLQIWLTPHGFVRAAMAGNPTAESQTREGREVTVVSFALDGRFRVNGIISDQNLVQSVETWIANPVLGDMPVEIAYSNYQDFNGVKFPTKILQKQGGYPTLDLTVGDVQPNAAADIEVPDAVRQSTPQPVRVESEEVVDGVWHLTGGSHHSVAVEFRDFVVVVEAPAGEERSEAVIAEVKKLVPDKPLRYVVNTHHHFDHSGGLRTYVAEGATVVTHEMNRAFYERVWQAPRTLNPDRLSQAPRPATFETVTEKHVLTDGERTMEIHHIQGSGHNEGIIMAYLPGEKLLIEADVYSPRPGEAPPPIPNVFTVNLYDNIQRLNLDVDRIVPIHGIVVPLADLLQAIGRK
jgi:glyoxylase-like metal-dependent hydrolase (beta-lactamase superfamily II)